MDCAQLFSSIFLVFYLLKLSFSVYIVGL